MNQDPPTDGSDDTAAIEAIRSAVLWLADNADATQAGPDRPARGFEAIAQVFVAWPSRVWGTGVWLREYAASVSDESLTARFGPQWRAVVALAVRLGETPAGTLRAVSETSPPPDVESGVGLLRPLDLDRRLQASAAGAAALRATAHVDGRSGPMWVGYLAWAVCLQDVIVAEHLASLSRPLDAL